MQIGSLVETVGDFEEIRSTWHLPYPKKGDILTISGISKHGNSSVSKKGIVLLNFEELPNLVGVCDKTIHGEPNFVEVLPPITMSEVFKKELKRTFLSVKISS